MIGPTCVYSWFQSTHPRGCDRARVDQIAPAAPVSIHAPARVRPAGCSPQSAGWGFNPRTREGATRTVCIGHRALLGFQSTHPRGCDFSVRRWCRAPAVSIHAPARVRQGAGQHHYIHRLVSIHAPARVRRDVTLHLRRNGDVSIHAPVRVRPAPAQCACTTRKCFNPRTREGATRAEKAPCNHALFQSTHPRGCDTNLRHAHDEAREVSIHAPARVRLWAR